jgi:multiple sugar transport system permease protein
VHFRRFPHLAAWALIVPMLVIVIGVIGGPFIQAIILSFTTTKLGGLGGDWAGLDNYRRLVADENFSAAIGRTLYFTIVSVGLEMVLGVLVALLLNEDFHGRTFLRALLVLPWALPTVVNAIMWRLIYNPEFGSLNALLTQLGLLSTYRSWLGDPASAMNAIIAADVWKNYPLVALIALAALQSVPKELYQAAEIDGAGAFAKFRAITLPAIMPALMVALVLRSIEAFKVFDIVFVMTRGGPADSTKTVSFFVYQEAFSYMRAGSGASYALVAVLISLCLISVYLRLVRRQAA